MIVLKQPLILNVLRGLLNNIKNGGIANSSATVLIQSSFLKNHDVGFLFSGF